MVSYEIYANRTNLVSDLLENCLMSWDKVYSSGSSVEDNEIFEWGWSRPTRPGEERTPSDPVK